MCPTWQCCVGGRASRALCLQALCVSSKLWFNVERKNKAWNMHKLWYGVLFYVLWRFLITLAMPLCGEFNCHWLARWCAWFMIKLLPPQGEWLCAACERCGRVWGGSQPSGGGPEGGGASGAAAGPAKTGPSRDNSGGQPAERAQRSGTYPRYHTLKWKYTV